MRLSQVLSVVSLVTVAHAWPWPRAFGSDAMKAVEGFEALLKRQNNNGNGNAQPASTAANANAAATQSNANQGGGGGNAAQTTGTVSATSAKTNKTLTTAFDPRDPAGGISMVSPNPTSGAQYYKVGDWWHFAWNYTSLQATPTAVNIVASCSQNQATYTLAMNQSFAPTGEIYWDTGAYQSSAPVPLLTNQYTLIVWDAAQPISGTPRAGYLGTNSQFTFGVYTPQPYTPYSDYQCPTCSGSISGLERMTLGFLLGMASITVITFTWFASNANIL